MDPSLPGMVITGPPSLPDMVTGIIPPLAERFHAFIPVMPKLETIDAVLPPLMMLPKHDGDPMQHRVIKACSHPGWLLPIMAIATFAIVALSLSDSQLTGHNTETFAELGDGVIINVADTAPTTTHQQGDSVISSVIEDLTRYSIIPYDSSEVLALISRAHASLSDTYVRHIDNKVFASSVALLLVHGEKITEKTTK